MITYIKYLTKGILFMAIAIPLLTGCEGPSGSEGPQGPKGEVGSVGPAGEDGSQMYAGKGTPAGDIGTEGDYYLNNKTGELYGPKGGDGWGNPIIVLMGEDGKDGADGKNGNDGKDGQDGADGKDGKDGNDGQDGADGEDGSQIYSGTGAPDPAMGATGDFYLDKSSYRLYGPKTGSGWGMALNLKGADGNANVTRYMFGEHDFSPSGFWFHSIPVSYQEMQQSAWMFYMVKVSTNSSGGTVSINYYPVPGSGYISGDFYEPYYYNVNSNNSQSYFRINLTEGSGGDYDRIEIVRIKANNIVDNTSVNSSIVPEELDITDYNAVANYYGFGNGAGEMLKDN